MIKLNLLDHDKYAELFPSSGAVVGGVPTFGEYAQLWLDSREIAAGTRLNYKGTLNLYWVPHLALVRIDLITSTLLRRIVISITWTSASVKRNAMVKLSTILRSAVVDGLIARNPAEAIQLPARSRKEVDPFTLDEANLIIAELYKHARWPSQIYAAFFEFIFFTGLRLSEGLALRWDAVDSIKNCSRPTDSRTGRCEREDKNRPRSVCSAQRQSAACLGVRETVRRASQAGQGAVQ